MCEASSAFSGDRTVDRSKPEPVLPLLLWTVTSTWSMTRSSPAARWLAMYLLTEKVQLAKAEGWMVWPTRLTPPPVRQVIGPTLPGPWVIASVTVSTVTGTVLVLVTWTLKPTSWSPEPARRVLAKEPPALFVLSTLIDGCCGTTTKQLPPTVAGSNALVLIELSPLVEKKSLSFGLPGLPCRS